MKVGDLIRWNREGYDESLKLAWFEKQGIVLSIDDTYIRPPVITVMWDTTAYERFEEIFADELELVNESR